MKGELGDHGLMSVRMILEQTYADLAEDVLRRIDYLETPPFHNQHRRKSKQQQRSFVAIYFRLVGAIMHDAMNLNVAC